MSDQTDVWNNSRSWLGQKRRTVQRMTAMIAPMMTHQSAMLAMRIGSTQRL